MRLGRREMEGFCELMLRIASESEWLLEALLPARIRQGELACLASPGRGEDTNV